MLLSNYPANDTFSVEDMTVIERVMKALGCPAHHAARLHCPSDDGSLVLDLYFGYKWFVRREVRQVPITFKSLRGTRTEDYPINGYVVSREDHEAEEFFSDLETMLAHMMWQITHHLATNIGQDVSRSSAYTG